MTDQTKFSPRPSLFARKGEAEPAPSVAYVSLRQMQGKPDRREAEPDRRAQWGDGLDNRKSPDICDRRGSDHGNRRHFTPRSGLAVGQRFVPWTAHENKADAPEGAACKRQTKTSLSTLSSLIHRRRDGDVQPASRAPEPAPVPVVATASPTPYKRKIIRRQVTVRLEINQFLKIKALAEHGEKFRQTVMAAAIADYLNRIS